MRKITLYFVLLCIFASCRLDLSSWLVNENDDIYDVSESIDLPDSLFDVTEFYHIEKKTYVPIPGYVCPEFGLNVTASNEKDILTYTSDSLHKRLKYNFSIPTPVLPRVTLNYFSFTDEEGNLIPSVIYYNTINDEIHIIDKLPIIFTHKDEQNMRSRMFNIYVEGSQSYASTNVVYVNYDIEVGNKRYIKHVKYSRNKYYDWRPKFW